MASFSEQPRKTGSHFLALFWIAGLLFGIFCFQHTDNLLLLWMRRIPEGAVSIVGLLTVSVFPFLISAFAVYLCASKPLFVIAFLKAAVFSFVSCWISLSYKDAGWLIRFFYMGGSLISLPVLFWFWARHISGEMPFSWAEVFFILSMLFLLECVNFCRILPFAAILI